jgi:hypothetical protein
MKRFAIASAVLFGCKGDGGGDGAEASSTAGDDGADDASDDGLPAGPELDDEFNDDLADWEIVNASTADVQVLSGSLVIEPHALSLWFNASAGVLVAKRIAGDFVVTAPVFTRSVSSPSDPPSPAFRLGGLMARAPNSAEEDYVFIVFGADDADVSVETKSTDDAVSEYMGPPWPSGQGELRICREGARFTLLLRDSSASPWIQQAVFTREDLPNTLQVGALAYANADPPDLRVSYDAIRFAASGCQD